jgi:hypothetical protein
MEVKHKIKVCVLCKSDLLHCALEVVSHLTIIKLWNIGFLSSMVSLFSGATKFHILNLSKCNSFQRAGLFNSQKCKIKPALC